MKTNIEMYFLYRLLREGLRCRLLMIILLLHFLGFGYWYQR